MGIKGMRRKWGEAYDPLPPLAGTHVGVAGGAPRRGGRYPPPPKPSKFVPTGEGFEVKLLRPSAEDEWSRVILSEKANSKIWALVQECPIEISWLCTVSYDGKENQYVLEDVVVPKQDCTATTTHASHDSESEMLSELVESGRLDDINKLHCWGHSHVDMGVFASGTDKDQTSEYLESRGDFFIRLIANKRGQLYCTLYIIYDGFILENLTVQVPNTPPDLEGWREWANREIDNKVSQVKTVHAYPVTEGWDYDYYTKD